jgi:hypothetical protein
LRNRRADPLTGAGDDDDSLAVLLLDMTHVQASLTLAVTCLPQRQTRGGANC